MANIRTGSIVADIRGKVGTEIYSRNRGGAYVKNYVSPIQPNSIAQMTQRGMMATAVAAWQALSDPERQLWLNAALKAPTSGLGADKIRRSGYNEFISRKRNLLNISNNNNPTVIDASNQELWAYNITSLTETNFSVDTFFTSVGTVGIPIYGLIFKATAPQPASRMSHNGLVFRKLLGTESAGHPGFNATVTYETIFGSLVGTAGMKIFTSVKIFVSRMFIDGTHSDWCGKAIGTELVTSGIITV